MVTDRFDTSQVWAIREDTRILCPRASGVIGPWKEPVQSVNQTIYLGGVLSTDGWPQHELTRRIGEARAVFYGLMRIWKHTSIPCWRKQMIFDATMVPKLLYGVETFRRLRGRGQSPGPLFYFRRCSFYLLYSWQGPEPIGSYERKFLQPIFLGSF